MIPTLQSLGDYVVITILMSKCSYVINRQLLSISYFLLRIKVMNCLFINYAVSYIITSYIMA